MEVVNAAYDDLDLVIDLDRLSPEGVALIEVHRETDSEGVAAVQRVELVVAIGLRRTLKKDRFLLRRQSIIHSRSVGTILLIR